jgi:predicted dehydrogenase
VFVEKPLALTEAELRQVIAAAGEAEGILMVGFNRRFAPFVTKMRDFARRGGDLIAAVFRVSAGRLPHDHWAHDLTQGGGRLIGEVCHFIDTLRFVVDSPVAAVHAWGYGSPDKPRQAHDNLIIGLTFASGSVASIAYVSDGSPKVPKERLEVFTGSRTAILDDYVSLELLDLAGRTHEKARSQDKGHRAEIRAFVDGARSGRPPVALEQIENVSLATLAVVESLRTGLPVRLTQRPV